jgi:hypothetical protein
LDLDVYINVMYIVCTNYATFFISYVLIPFSAKKNYSPN